MTPRLNPFIRRQLDRQALARTSLDFDSANRAIAIYVLRPDASDIEA
jgi:hypothetical protein